MSFAFSAKAHYACVTMLELALRDGEDRPVALREITAKHDIPQAFVVQILQQLKLAGFVSSTRGSQGGYRIAVPVDSLSLLDICEAIGCSESSDCAGSATSTPEATALHHAWQTASVAYRQALENTRLEDLVRQCASSDSTMFYI